MDRIEKTCPRCMGERGFWSMPKSKTGMWSPCRTCKTQGKVKVASMAEFRRLEHNVLHPKKAQTKQREKEK
jgi:hypothetical protein